MLTHIMVYYLKDMMCLKRTFLLLFQVRLGRKGGREAMGTLLRKSHAVSSTCPVPSSHRGDFKGGFVIGFPT